MSKVKELIELLEKISRTTDKMRIEIDYDGKEFFWKVPIANLKAHEFCPRNNKKRPDDAA